MDLQYLIDEDRYAKLKEENDRLVALAHAISRACFEEAESLRAEIADLKHRRDSALELCRLKVSAPKTHIGSYELAAYSSEIIDILTGATDN